MAYTAVSIPLLGPMKFSTASCRLNLKLTRRRWDHCRWSRLAGRSWSRKGLVRRKNALIERRKALGASKVPMTLCGDTLGSKWQRRESVRAEIDDYNDSEESKLESDGFLSQSWDAEGMNVEMF